MRDFLIYGVRVWEYFAALKSTVNRRHYERRATKDGITFHAY
jgi:hypothetical protein